MDSTKVKTHSAGWRPVVPGAGGLERNIGLRHGPEAEYLGGGPLSGPRAYLVRMSLSLRV
jgi:hypothetical protein